jgi:hypothetical protein
MFRNSEQQILPHTDRLFVPLCTGLLEKMELHVISLVKLKLLDKTAESLSLARAQRMNRNTVGRNFNMLEKVASENNLFDALDNIFNIDDNGRQISNKPASVKTANWSKSVRVLTSGGKIESIIVIVCCNTASQFLPPFVIFKGFYMKQEVSDGLHPGSVVCMNRRSSFISTDLSSGSQSLSSKTKL